VEQHHIRRESICAARTSTCIRSSTGTQQQQQPVLPILAALGTADLAAGVKGNTLHGLQVEAQAAESWGFQRLRLFRRIPVPCTAL
jgi:hypothetical protein